MTQDAQGLMAFQQQRQADQALTVAVQHWDRTSALLDNRVKVPNVGFIGVPNRTAWDGLFSGIFAAAELPMARFIFGRDQGDPLIGIPVFLDRLFLQRYIYVRADDPINSLAELRGRRVCLPHYYQTPCFWHRQFLREAGVQPDDVQWITTSPERDTRMRTPASVNLSVIEDNSNGVNLLLNGQVDCVMYEYTLVAPRGQEGRMRWLYANTLEVHAEWFKRTGIFPTLHVLVAREDDLKRRPDLGVELCQAFDRAKQEMYTWLQSERTTGLPFAREAIDWSLEICGDDPWPYGIEKNMKELNQILDLAQADGFTKQRRKVEEIFDARSLEYQFTSRMGPTAQHLLT